MFELTTWIEFRNKALAPFGLSLFSRICGNGWVSRCPETMEVKIAGELSDPYTGTKESYEIGTFEYKFRSDETAPIEDWTHRGSTLRPCWRYHFPTTPENCKRYQQGIAKFLKAVEAKGIDFAPFMARHPSALRPPKPIIIYAKHRTAQNDRVAHTTHTPTGDCLIWLHEPTVCYTKPKL